MPDYSSETTEKITGKRSLEKDKDICTLSFKKGPCMIILTRQKISQITFSQKDRQAIFLFHRKDHAFIESIREFIADCRMQFNMENIIQSQM